MAHLPSTPTEATTEEPTAGLRFVMQHNGMKVLQQAFAIRNAHQTRTEWRDVPLVTPDACRNPAQPLKAQRRRREMIVNGLRLEMTCAACPEQYDVYMGAVQVGYLRIRNGAFRADYPDCGGETVYEAAPDGDGIFRDYERDRYFADATAALLAHHKAQQENDDGPA